jgi:large-conductance mechanosensitive channel
MAAIHNGRNPTLATQGEEEKPAPAPAPSKEQILLTEIRDALRAR